MNLGHILKIKLARLIERLLGFGHGQLSEEEDGAEGKVGGMGIKGYKTVLVLRSLPKNRKKGERGYFLAPFTKSI